jgi:hypothetical protein
MPDLETRLRALGADTHFPPTPDLAVAVCARLAEAGTAAAQPTAVRRRRTLAVAIALALLVPAAAIAAVPSTRHAVLDWLGLRGVEVRRVPTPPSGTSTAPDAGDLGRPLALAAARRRVSFKVLVPSVLPTPRRAFVAGSPPGGRVSFLFARAGRRPRLLITEFRGSRTRTFVEKVIGPGARAVPVRVGDARGVWITGRPHAFIYADRDGAIRTENTRLAGSVLLWERGGLVLRIEGGLTRAQALRIATSLH